MPTCEDMGPGSGETGPDCPAVHRLVWAGYLTEASLPMTQLPCPFQGQKLELKCPQALWLLLVDTENSTLGCLDGT